VTNFQKGPALPGLFVGAPPQQTHLEMPELPEVETTRAGSSPTRSAIGSWSFASTRSGCVGAYRKTSRTGSGQVILTPGAVRNTCCGAGVGHAPVASGNVRQPACVCLPTCPCFTRSLRSHLDSGNTLRSMIRAASAACITRRAIQTSTPCWQSSLQSRGGRVRCRLPLARNRRRRVAINNC